MVDAQVVAAEAPTGLIASAPCEPPASPCSTPIQGGEAPPAQPPVASFSYSAMLNKMRSGSGVSPVGTPAKADKAEHTPQPSKSPVANGRVSHPY